MIKQITMYYDIESSTYYTRQELEKEFIELIEMNEIDYNLNQFELYLIETTGKNGTLQVVIIE